MTRKVLIVGPSWIGDMVMAQVLFKLIKQNEPSVQLDVLAPNWSLPVLGRMPEVAEVIGLPIEHGQFALKARIAIARNLSTQNYSQAIILPNSWKSALIPWLAKIPKRTGWLGEARWGLLNDVRYLQAQKLPKMVQRYAALGFESAQELPTILPIPELTALPVALDTTKPVLALCPGAAYGPAKRWPMEYFAQIATEKLKDGWQVWFFGSSQDVVVINNIQSMIGAETKSFAGKVNLSETIDLLATVQAVVSNDSGLLHIAASLNKPVIAIYGSTSAEFTPPLGNKSKIVQEALACRPCFKRECPLRHLNCMYLIKPERVMAAIQELVEI